MARWTAAALLLVAALCLQAYTASADPSQCLEPDGDYKDYCGNCTFSCQTGVLQCLDCPCSCKGTQNILDKKGHLYYNKYTDNYKEKSSKSSDKSSKKSGYGGYSGYDKKSKAMPNPPTENPGDYGSYSDTCTCHRYFSVCHGCPSGAVTFNQKTSTLQCMLNPEAKGFESTDYVCPAKSPVIHEKYGSGVTKYPKGKYTAGYTPEDVKPSPMPKQKYTHDKSSYGGSDKSQGYGGSDKSQGYGGKSSMKADKGYKGGKYGGNDGSSPVPKQKYTHDKPTHDKSSSYKGSKHN